MFNSVRIGNKDMYTDFGCILAHVEISAPSVQTKFVQVPLRNGNIDLTELLTDEPKYDSRKIKLTLKYASEKQDDYITLQSNLANYLHGQRMNINFDNDINYFYSGRVEYKGYTVIKHGIKITIEAECDPFKYTVLSSLDDWLWDTFDFEEGYINDLRDIPISGNTDVVIIGDEKLTYATVTSNAQMTATFDNVTVTIPVGTYTLYDFELEQGDNTIRFNGNGTISIEYRGGRL